MRRFETQGEISLASLLRIAQTIDRLQDFDALFHAAPITDLREL